MSKKYFCNLFSIIVYYFYIIECLSEEDKCIKFLNNINFHTMLIRFSSLFAFFFFFCAEISVNIIKEKKTKKKEKITCFCFQLGS